MRKYVECFSNGTEAMQWEFHNCDQCKRKSSCYPRQNIQKGYIIGHISLNTASFIGMQSYDEKRSNCTLKNLCDHFNDPIVSNKKPKIYNTNELTLF